MTIQVLASDSEAPVEFPEYSLDYCEKLRDFWSPDLREAIPTPIPQKHLCWIRDALETLRQPRHQRALDRIDGPILMPLAYELGDALYGLVGKMQFNELNELLASLDFLNVPLAIELVTDRMAECINAEPSILHGMGAFDSKDQDDVNYRDSLIAYCHVLDPEYDGSGLLSLLEVRDRLKTIRQRSE